MHEDNAMHSMHDDDQRQGAAWQPQEPTHPGPAPAAWGSNQAQEDEDEELLALAYADDDDGDEPPGDAALKGGSQGWQQSGQPAHSNAEIDDEELLAMAMEFG